MTALAFGCCFTFAACGNQGTTQDGSDSETQGDKTSETETETERVYRYETTLTEEIVDVSGEKLAVRFCREDMVHFRFLPSGEIFQDEDAVPESIAKFDREYEPVHGERVEEGNSVILRTEGITVSIDKTNMQITVTDPAGKKIFSSASQAFSVSGESKKASFKRDMAGTEHFFGLGNDPGSSFTTTDHRGSVYEIWMNDDNVHAIVPLWYSTNGYGIYSNNSNKGQVSFNSDYYLSVEGGELNFYFFYGPEFKTILTNWSELAGRMNMPPLYALGLTYRGYGQWNETQLLDALTTQLNAGIKIDVAGAEPGWQNKTYPCDYQWSSKFTKDAESFIQKAHELGLHVNLWEHPYVSPNASIYEEIMVYSLSGKTIGTREWEGNSGTYAFSGIVPDMTIEEARDIWWSVHDENLVSIGVDGYKIDETDSWGASNSLDLLFPSGISNNAYHNLLGTLTVNLLHEKYRDEYNLRTFIFSRGNYAGMQRYATTAYTDYYGFDQFVMSVLTGSYSGTYYTPEIRDVSTKSDVDYMRRTQLMFLTPFPMSNEWASEASVLGRSDSVIKCYQKYNQLHYDLIPYMYSLFWEQHNTGIGVVRSLVMEFQNDPKTYKIDNEFMLGDALLVCPVNSPNRLATVDIYLPAGERWMDYNTGYIYEGGKTIAYTCGADVLPLFVRMGSVIPTGHYGKNTSDVTDTTLTLDIYPGEAHQFTLYEDDGISYGYTRGKYALTEISSKFESGKIECTVGSRTGGYAVSSRACVLQLHYRSAPSDVTVDGTKIPAAASLNEFMAATSPCYFYDGTNANDFEKIIYVRLTDDGRAHTVSLTVGAEGAQTLPDVVLSGSLYECEASTNQLKGCSVSKGKSYASGNALVSSVGNDGKNVLTMNGIKAPADGFYEMEIVYFNGDQKPRNLDISVNGGDVISISCPGMGKWETGGTINLVLPLKKGDNQITFTTLPGNGWAPDLDALIVYDESTVDTTPKGTVYAPSDAVLTGDLELVDNAGAALGQSVKGFGISGPSLMTYEVHVDKAGPYQLNITYSNPFETDAKLDLYINGEKSELQFPGTLSRQLFKTLNLTVYLEAGENTVALGCDGGDARFECETGGEYKNCNTKLNDGEHEHSGGYCVGASANNGAFQFTMKGIEAPSTGTYTLKVYCGSGDARTFRLKVNDEDVGDLYTVRTGHFHVFQPTTIEVDLTKGENTLTFWQDTTAHGDTLWVPNFDYVTIEGISPMLDIQVGLITIQ